MDFFVRLRPSLHSAFAIMTALCAAAVPGAARAQDVQVDELPEIVVEGATLETAKAKPRVAKKTASDPAPVKPSQKSAGSAADFDAGNVPAVQSGEPLNSSADAAAETVPQEASAGTPIDRIGSAVAVVTGAELRARQIRNAGEALRNLPGVHVNRGTGATGLTQVRIRGAEANQTLVLIDGIKANDATNGEFDFSDLSTDNIERIEVIRGAQSSIYGAGAVGGVINIVTRGGKGPLTFRTFAEAGTFATREGGFAVSAGSDDIWGSISLSKRTTGGYNIAVNGPENDSGELTSLAFRSGVRVARGLTLDLTMRHTDKDGDRDTEDVQVGKLQEQTDDPANFNATTWLHGARLTWQGLDGALTQSVHATRNETHRIDDSPLTFFKSDYLGETLNYSYTGTYRFDVPIGQGMRNALTWLIEDEKERFTPNSSSYDPNPFNQFQDDGFARIRNRIAYAGEWRGDFDDRLIVTAGVRHDDNDTFEDFTTWRTTGTLRIPEIGLRPHASAGTAVKAPTMFEQFGTIPLFFTPNPALIPEESFSWDVGLELATSDRQHWIDVTYFEADLERQINGFAPGAGGTFTAVNREGVSDRKGIEVAARSEIIDGITLSGSYTYLEATTAEGLAEFRRPRHSGRADLKYAFSNGKGNISIGALYNGEMDDPVRRVTAILVFPGFGSFPILQAERFSLDEYLVVNIAASYEVMPGIELYGRVENAFNENYQEIFGFESADVAGYVGVRFTGVVEETRAWSEGR